MVTMKVECASSKSPFVMSGEWDITSTNINDGAKYDDDSAGK